MDEEKINLDNTLDDAFWKKWEESNLLDRHSHVKKLINQNIRWLLLDTAKFRTEREERLFLMALSTLMNSYLEELHKFMIKKFTETVSSAYEIAKEEMKDDDGNAENEKRENE